jgi:MipA family protein
VHKYAEAPAYFYVNSSWRGLIGHIYYVIPLVFAVRSSSMCAASHFVSQKTSELLDHMMRHLAPVSAFIRIFKSLHILLFMAPILALLPVLTLAADAAPRQEPAWGVGMSYRVGQIPFTLQGLDDKRVTSLVPLFYYQGERFFLDGSQGGMHLWQSAASQRTASGRAADWQLDVHAQLRFVDIPKSWQNQKQADSVDTGLRLKHEFDDVSWGALGGYTDGDGHWYLDGTIGQNWSLGSWNFRPSLLARYKSASFNSRYYAGVVGSAEQLGAGTESTAALDTRWHINSNFYLLNKLAYTRFDSEVRSSAMMSRGGQAEAWLGFGFFESPEQMRQASLPPGAYLRLAQGWATPSDISEVFMLQTKADPNHNRMSSLFYGHPLSNELFGFPIDLYLTPGVVWHWPSAVQSSTQEYVMAFKGYYTFRWPTRWRFGFAEGLSYVNDITWIESSEMAEKGYRPSHLMNYLDFSVDTNLGDLFGNGALRHLWLGYGLHHRSAMFEAASMFGRIKGGSNYNTLYLQWQF